MLAFGFVPSTSDWAEMLKLPEELRRNCLGSWTQCAGPFGVKGWKESAIEFRSFALLETVVIRRVAD